MTYSHMGTPTLPSAQLHFTSEFGMDSGGSTTLLSLGEIYTGMYLCRDGMDAKERLLSAVTILESDNILIQAHVST